MTKRRTLLARMTPLEEKRQVRVTVSTETLGRDKLVVMTKGIDLTAFRANPVCLWQHNADWPIARAVDIHAEGRDLVALAQFPQAGTSVQADEAYGLIREGIVSGASIGFEDEIVEPVDPNDPRAGWRVTRCELAEFSFVSIPALPDALVTERARRAKEHTTMRLDRSHYLLAARFERELAPPAKLVKPLKPRQRPVRHSILYHRHMAAKFAAELRSRRP